MHQLCDTSQCRRHGKSLPGACTAPAVPLGNAAPPVNVREAPSSASSATNEHHLLVTDARDLAQIAFWPSDARPAPAHSKATGEAVDESTIDWNTVDDPDATPENGMRHANTVDDGFAYTPTYYCLDYRAAGFNLASWFAHRVGLDSNTGQSSVEDDADSAAACAQAQADQDESDRRERRKVIALNRLGDAAMQVRREFVTKLLTRKTLPKGAAIFIADCLVREPLLLSGYQAPATTSELLGVGHRESLHTLVTDLPATGDGRAQVLTLAVVLGALETRTPKDAWRYPRNGRSLHRASIGEYLTFLAAHGYQLADVERIMVEERTSDDVYDETLSVTVVADDDDSDGTESEPAAEPDGDGE